MIESVYDRACTQEWLSVKSSCCLIWRRTQTFFPTFNSLKSAHETLFSPSTELPCFNFASNHRPSVNLMTVVTWIVCIQWYYIVDHVPLHLLRIGCTRWQLTRHDIRSLRLKYMYELAGWRRKVLIKSLFVYAYAFPRWACRAVLTKK